MSGDLPLPTDRMTWIAMFGAGLMLAHQVSGKAVRDSFFLTYYPAAALPRIVIAAAIFSLIFVLLFSRALARFGPRRLVPAGFLLSAVVHLAEFQFASSFPRLLSVVIYLHIVGFGAILMSGFWSLATESFDPRTAKRTFGHITSAGTLGGIAGGLLAERTAAMLSAQSVLLLLAALHFSCAVVLAAMRRTGSAEPRADTVEHVRIPDLFRRAPYLINIAVLVLVGTASAGLADYLFKSGAGAVFGKGASLLRFFAIFYTSTQILTFGVQALCTRPVLSKFSVGRTISFLPIGVGAGSLAGLLIPALPTFTILRSLEQVLRGSLFRSAYELLYTPVPPAEKRAAKTFIDVGCDRAGDALGAAIVQVMLAVGGRFLVSELLGMALVLAAVAMWLASRLDAAYSGAVERRLVDRAVELDLTGLQDTAELSAILRSASIDRYRPPADRPAPATPRVVPKALAPADSTLDLLRELRSGDHSRVLSAIDAAGVPSRLIAAQLISLLAWDEVAGRVRDALLQSSDCCTGLLIDNLTDEKDVPFGVRRRIPRILAHGSSQLAVHGLISGLNDTRFEVRFQCSRALDVLHQRRPDLTVPAEAVFAAIERELRVARTIWQSRRLIDQRESSDASAFLDEHLKERSDRSLEHVFSLMAAVLPREPVKVAFRALHTDDPSLRGLALEYLDGVLPENLRARLWEMAEQQPGAATRPPQEAMEELLRSREAMLPGPDRA